MAGRALYARGAPLRVKIVKAAAAAKMQKIPRPRAKTIRASFPLQSAWRMKRLCVSLRDASMVGIRGARAEGWVVYWRAARTAACWEEERLSGWGPDGER